MYECIIYAWPVIPSLSDGGVGGGRWHISACRSGRESVFGGGSTMVKRARERSRRGERSREKQQTHEDGARVMHIETRRGRAKKKERERERKKRSSKDRRIKDWL